MDKEKIRHQESVSRAAFIVLCMHVLGILCAYMYVPTVLEGNVVGSILGGIALMLVGYFTSKCQLVTKSRLAAYNKKYSEDDE